MSERTQPSAKIIADSISTDGSRVTTMQVTMHRFVLAEFNTHRVFSRNSASSRAIPAHKQVQRVVDDLAYPVVWPAEQKGMQGGAELDGTDGLRLDWRLASHHATGMALEFIKRGLHKSVTNRLLEPFMWHTVVVTSTAWQNFFALRLDADAQPEIRVAAEAMKVAYDASEPQVLRRNEWHLPYVESEDWDALAERTHLGLSMYPEMAKISAARCARTSYLTQEGKRDLTEDLHLYDRLVTDRLDKGLAIHWSPLEHVATPWPQNYQDDPLVFTGFNGEHFEVLTDHLPRVGNLAGWRSLRTTVEASVGAKTFS